MNRNTTKRHDRGRPPASGVCAILATAPFWFVVVPPLTDVPGHMGRAAIAAWQDDPAFRRLMGFRWYPVPNLGADLIVEALRHVVSITRAYWLVAMAIPALLTLGLFATARALNRDGAAALPWALLFVWCFPFSYGFLNTCWAWHCRSSALRCGCGSTSDRMYERV